MTRSRQPPARDSRSKVHSSNGAGPATCRYAALLSNQLPRVPDYVKPFDTTQPLATHRYLVLCGIGPHWAALLPIFGALQLRCLGR